MKTLCSIFLEEFRILLLPSCHLKRLHVWSTWGEARRMSLNLVYLLLTSTSTQEKNILNNASNYEPEKEKGVDIHLLQQKIRPKTPSISSEASSWNSQSVLLQSLHRNTSRTKHRKGFGMKHFPFFGCPGSCSEKKAVYINKSVDYGVLHDIQQSQPEPKMVEQFSFPVLNSGITNLKVDKQFKEETVQVDPRNSIEVFGSTKAKKRDNIAVNMERKLSILTWDAIPKVQSLVTASFGSSALCDDMASDASSDLFEIENISGIDHAVLSRQESCNTSCMSPTTQYAPSEASIQWSVVAASAADFSSVVSDYEDASVSVKGRMISGHVRNKNNCLKKVEPPKSGSSKLLGCRNHKAVRAPIGLMRNLKDKTKIDFQESPLMFLLAACITITVFIYVIN